MLLRRTSPQGQKAEATTASRTPALRTAKRSQPSFAGLWNAISTACAPISGA